MQLKNAKILVLISIISAISSCSLISPHKAEAIKSYYLNIESHPNKKFAVSNRTLAIATPSAEPMFDTKFMAYSIQPSQINYFVKNEWAEKPSQMLQTLLVQKFQDAGQFRHVLALPSIGHADILLVTNLVEFMQDFTQKPNQMKINLHAQLVDTKTLKVISSKAFSTMIPMDAVNPYSGVQAANQGAEIIVNNIIEWANSLKHNSVRINN